VHSSQTTAPPTHFQKKAAFGHNPAAEQCLGQEVRLDVVSETVEPYFIKLGRGEDSKLEQPQEFFR
jgi:hypothetical protein